MLVSGSHFSNKIVSLGIGLEHLPVVADGATVALSATASGSTSGEARQIAGHPINEQWYRPYTYSDDNGDGVLQVSEVHVDSSFVSYGYRVPRDIISIQNGVRPLQPPSAHAGMFDYKGGASILDGANNFQCNTGPFACRDTQDPTAPLDRQAAAIAKTYGTTLNGTSYKTSAGYFMNNQFWKFREFSAMLQLPERRQPARCAPRRGSTLVFGARNLHTWSYVDRRRSGSELRPDAVGSAERVPDDRPADVLHAPTQPQVLTPLEDAYMMSNRIQRARGMVRPPR